MVTVVSTMRMRIAAIATGVAALAGLVVVRFYFLPGHSSKKPLD